MADERDPLAAGHDPERVPGADAAVRREVMEALTGDVGFLSSGAPGDGQGEEG